MAINCRCVSSPAASTTLVAVWPFYPTIHASAPWPDRSSARPTAIASITWSCANPLSDSVSRRGRTVARRIPFGCSPRAIQLTGWPPVRGRNRRLAELCPGKRGAAAHPLHGGRTCRCRWASRRVSNGLILRFNTHVDAQSLDIHHVLCEQWNYLYSAAYGSPEFSVKQPGRRGHDLVAVTSLHLLPDGQSLFLEIPQLHPVMQLHVYLQLAQFRRPAVSRGHLLFDLSLGRCRLPTFRDIEPIAKTRIAAFPHGRRYPRDARLIAQENLGKDFSTLQGVVSLQINAVAGLRYEPRVLRVPPGQRVALVFKNTDPSMPHNWVLDAARSSRDHRPERDAAGGRPPGFRQPLRASRRRGPGVQPDPESERSIHRLLR